MTVTRFHILLSDPRFMPRDEGTGEGGSGEGQGGTGTGEGGSGTGTGEGEGGSTTPGSVKFDAAQQKKVDEIVQKRLKGARQELETAEKRYETLLTQSNLTKEERDQLQGDLASVQSQLRSKEQQAAINAKKQADEYQAKLEQSAQRGDRYENLFKTSIRDNEIIAEANTAGAYNPEQFIALMADRTSVVEIEDEQGEKTGRFASRVKVIETGEDGTQVEVEKTIKEAIESMKEETDRYGNLFRGNVAKGIGQGSNAGTTPTGRVDVSKMSDAEYFANRDQLAPRLGLNTKRSF